LGHERNARKSAAIAAASPEPRRAQDTHVTGDDKKPVSPFIIAPRAQVSRAAKHKRR